MTEVSRALKAIRIKKGLTQKKMAEYMGVPMGTYKSWEYALSVPDFRYRDTLYKLDPDLIKKWERDKMAV